MKLAVVNHHHLPLVGIRRIHHRKYSLKQKTESANEGTRRYKLTLDLSRIWLTSSWPITFFCRLQPLLSWLSPSKTKPKREILRRFPPDIVGKVEEEPQWNFTKHQKTTSLLTKTQEPAYSITDGSESASLYSGYAVDRESPHLNRNQSQSPRVFSESSAPIWRL